MNPETESFDCYKCEDIYHNDEAHITDEGKYCMDCYADTFIPCYECGEDTKDEKIYMLNEEDGVEEGGYCGICAYEKLEYKLSEAIGGMDITKQLNLFRKFIKECKETKETEYKLFHQRLFRVRDGEDILSDESGKWIFNTYAEAKALFVRLREKREHTYLDITEIPTILEEDWKEMFPYHEYPAEKLLKTWKDIPKIIGEEQYALWEKLKGTPEYDTYCGVPGCMNYMLGLPFSRYLVE